MSRSSTSSRRRRRAVGTSSCGRSCPSSSDAGLTVEVNRISAGTTSLPLQLLQLRLPPAPPLRPGRRALRPPRRRSDCDLSRLRRRDGRSNRGDQPGARRCDDRAVAVQPRRASRARDRARRPALDLECSRPVDLPCAGRARAARGTACTSHRDELVRQPEQGRRGHRLARPAPRPRSLRADVRGSHGRDVRARSRPRTDRVGTACRRVAAKRRLPGAEPERPLLERTARGARERAPGRLPRERRASGARGRRRRGVRRARGGRGSPRPPRLRARRAPCRDPGRHRSRRLRIAISRCFAGDGAFAAGAARARLCGREDARVAESLTPLRRRRANDLVRGRGRATSRSDRATSRVRHRCFEVGTVRDRAGGLPHQPLRGSATPLDASRRTASPRRISTDGRGRPATRSSTVRTTLSARRPSASLGSR